MQELAEVGVLDAAAVNEVRTGGLRAFYGDRGIWADKARTSGLAADGVTVGVLHTGRSYADDLLPDGIVYHYPRTSVAGRDAQEVSATKAAKALGLPIFVIVQPDSSSRRVFHLGWVEDWDDRAELFLITFGAVPPPPLPAVPDEDEIPFELGRSGETRKKTLQVSRPGQHRFSFRVFRRYRAECAACEVSVMGLLDAAHLRSYRDGGSDDPRNGLVFCATHHRAFDKQLFGIEPSTRRLVCREDGPNAQDLGITKSSLSGMSAQPHADALTWCWSRFHGKPEPPGSTTT
jgi:hypothetical protein